MEHGKRRWRRASLGHRRRDRRVFIALDEPLSVERTAMQHSLSVYGRRWCKRLAERIYKISVDSFSEQVLPSLNVPGWQIRHLDWEFKSAPRSCEDGFRTRPCNHLIKS